MKNGERVLLVEIEDLKNQDVFFVATSNGTDQFALDQFVRKCEKYKSKYIFGGTLDNLDRKRKDKCKITFGGFKCRDESNLFCTSGSQNAEIDRFHCNPDIGTAFVYFRMGKDYLCRCS